MQRRDLVQSTMKGTLWVENDENDENQEKENMLNIFEHLGRFRQIKENWYKKRNSHRRALSIIVMRSNM